MSAIDVVYEGETGSWVVARAAQQGTETFVEYTDDHVAHQAELAPVRHLMHAAVPAAHSIAAEAADTGDTVTAMREGR